ncbi:MAG: ribosome-associated translation inhibitor RaiA [Magnetococcales bacterium]|nr:ribosome-associated translation inhibitor RaiA [Magnetococcales bacterium]
MDIKMEGRQVELGDDLRERIQSRFDSLDDRFGPMSHARISVEKKAHKNDQRAEVTAVVHIGKTTLTASKEAPTVIAAVNDTLDTLTREIKNYTGKRQAKRRRVEATVEE